MESKVHVFSDSVLCVWEKRINTRYRTPNEKGDCGSEVHSNTKKKMDSMENQWSSCGKYSGHPKFRATSAVDRGQLKSREGREGNRFISVRMQRPSEQFFALLFLQISSVVLEQTTIYVENLKHR